MNSPQQSDPFAFPHWPDPFWAATKHMLTVPRNAKMLSMETRITNFRIPADIKEAAVAKAKSEGKTLSRVVIDLLREYARED